MRCCIVPECNDKCSRRFSIPADERIKKIWIDRIGKPEMLEMNTSHLQKNFPICANHFDPVCIHTNGRLLPYALPTLNLPGVYDSCFSYPPPEYKYVTPEKVKDILQTTSESAYSPETWAVNVSGKVYPLSAKRRRTVLFGDNVPCTSKDETVDASIDLVNVQLLPSPSQASPSERPEVQYMLCTYPETPKRARRLLPALGVTRQSQLSPKAKILYNKAKNWKKLARRLTKQKVSVQRKLKFLNSKAALLNGFKDVNPVTAKKFLSQLRTQKYKPRGRRFTIDDKILALSIYKQSGKSYRFLSNIFSLPSRKVLCTLLNKISFNCGINESVFAHLKNRVSKMKRIDRYCVLMFDEVALSPGLQYNSKTDSIDGFVDYGGTERCLSFADHALTFIVKGIRKKWKQPVCFTFCEGTTPTADLARILKLVIRQLRKCGLNIVVTISDQGATNQAVINQLLASTSRHFAEENEENRLQGYLVDGEEVIHLYDFPHLMKCIRNMLLHKDLHFLQEGVHLGLMLSDCMTSIKIAASIVN